MQGQHIKGSSTESLPNMISQRGIEANPEKIKAIIDMEMPKTQKDIQSLTGRVATLTRFISKATDKCVPFFKALKGGKQHIAWTAECDKAFQDLKNYMSRASLLSKPLPGKVLFLYLSVSSNTVRSVLIRKLEKAELPIFYVSKALQNAEIWYPYLEQLALALIVSARRLHPYFQAHEITVLTNQPLRQGCGASLVLTTLDGAKVEYALRFNFRTSNNEAKYEVLLAGLRLAKSMNAKQKFQAYEIRQIPRIENSHADALTRLASTIDDKVGRRLQVEILAQPSTETSEARKLRYRSTRCTVINDILYKRSYTTSYLKCITTEQGDYVLQEIHGDVCGDHSGSRSLAHKAFWQGYYWPTMHQDADTLLPQSNGQVKAINKIIKKLFKRQLNNAKGAWPEKLPEALWASRTSFRTSTGEAVVPVEIGEPSYRMESFEPKANEEALALNLDLIEERRAQANIRNKAYK
ncbi:unnamed protein product [Prunus armeniaca]